MRAGEEVHGGKEGLGSPGAGVYRVVSHHAGAKNRARVFGESSLSS